MQNTGWLRSSSSDFAIDRSALSGANFKKNQSLLKCSFDASVKVVKESSTMVAGHRASELQPPPGENFPLLEQSPNSSQDKRPVLKANNQFLQWRVDKETVKTEKAAAKAEKKAAKAPSVPLRERLSNLGAVIVGIKDHLPSKDGVKSKLEGTLSKISQVSTSISNTTAEELKGNIKIKAGDVSFQIKNRAIDAGQKIVKTPGEIFAKGKSLGERAVRRLGERGKDRNLILCVRLTQWTSKGLHTVMNVGVMVAPAIGSTLSVLATAASGAGAAIGLLLAGIIAYSTLKKLWKMDSPIEFIREKAPKIMTKVLPERIKVGPLEKFVKGNSLSKERITQYAVTKRELARLTDLKNKGEITPDDMQKYYMLRVVDRKLFYRRLNAGISLAQASIITVASVLSIAGLCSGPAGPALLGVGIGIGIGGMVGCISLRLGIFAVRRIRRNFINDVGGDDGKKYITSDEMRRYTFDKLKKEMEAQSKDPDSSNLANVMSPQYKSKELKMTDVEKWNSSELALFLMMRGNRDKTQLTARNSEGDFKPRFRKVSPESFRNSLFEVEGSKADFNGAWKKAFGG